MWLALIAVAACLVVVAVVAFARRSGHDELQSVRTYHAALGTIERLPGRAASSADPGPRHRVSSPDSDEEPDPSVRPIAGDGTARPARTVPPARLMFDDASPVDHPASAPGGSPAHRQRRSELHALASMNRRSRQGTAVFVVVILAILVGALAYLGTRHSRGHAAAGSTPSTVAPVRAHHHDAPPHTKKAKKHSSAPPEHLTRLVATTATAGTATYSVATVPFTVTVTASQPCWVDATSQPAGTTLWTGTLAAGGSQSIPASGLTAIELGAPGTSLTVDGVPVIFPASSSTPFTATFQPAQ